MLARRPVQSWQPAISAATLMHLDGVPVAVMAAWIGHSDPTLTLRVYAHSQNDALKAAGASLDRSNASSV